MPGLSAKRSAFVAEYLKCWNGAEAARRAGYADNTANRTAARLMSNVDIQAHIQQRIREKAMGADEVLLRLGEQARGEVGRYIGADGRVDLERIIADGKQHLVKGTKWDRAGNLVVEFYDAQSALALIGRHHKLFIDQLQLSGEVDIEINDYREELERRLSGLVAADNALGISAEPE